MPRFFIVQSALDIVDTVLGQINNTFNQTDYAFNRNITMYLDASGNKTVQGTIQVLDLSGNEVIKYNILKQVNYDRFLLTDSSVVSNFDYIVTNYAQSLGTGTFNITYNDSHYTCTNCFSINGKKFYVINPV